MRGPVEPRSPTRGVPDLVPGVVITEALGAGEQAGLDVEGEQRSSDAGRGTSTGALVDELAPNRSLGGVLHQPGATGR